MKPRAPSYLFLYHLYLKKIKVNGLCLLYTSLPPGVKQSKATESAVARGDFFIRADLTIKNNGDGTIGALAVALTRFPVDEAYITIYLDRWDEESERWRQVKYHEEEFYAEEGTEGLEMPTVDMSFIDQPRGYYYRLRGSFSVVYKGNFEGFSPVTDGILFCLLYTSRCV